ncbi:Myotubularin-like protein, partial [Phytophthora palmivora]
MATERESDFYVDVTREGCREGFEAQERQEDDVEYTSVVELMSPTSSSSNGSGGEFYAAGHENKRENEEMRTPMAPPTSATATETDSDLEESRSDEKDKEEEKAEEKRREEEDEECKGLGETEDD